MLPLIILLQAAATAVPATPTSPPAPWTAITRTNPANGATSVSAYAMARDGNARMTVRCDTVGEHVVSVQVRTKAPMAAGEEQPVTVRYDEATPISAYWQFPGVAMLNSNPTTVTNLTSGLVGSHTVTVSTGEGPTAMTEIFDGPASADGIKAVLGACGYQLGVVPAPPPAPKAK